MWWEILEATLLKSEMRQGCQIPPLLFSIVLQFPTKAIRQENEIKVMYLERKKVKLSQFADDKILCTDNPKKSIKNFIGTSK